jgi:hypothetical protein
MSPDYMRDSHLHYLHHLNYLYYITKEDELRVCPYQPLIRKYSKKSKKLSEAYD